MVRTFHADWSEDGGETVQRQLFHNNLKGAATKAANLSRRIGSAYVIISDGGREIGQRVYEHGAFAYEEMVGA
jgi:hypothetical protein